MSTNNTGVIGDNQIHLLDELQILLEKQIELARQGNIRAVEELSKQADSLVEKIAQTGILAPADPAPIEPRLGCADGRRRPEHLTQTIGAGQREQLRKLYEDLCLVITAQKADVSGKLSRVRKGKKTVQTYRSHI